MVFDPARPLTPRSRWPVNKGSPIMTRMCLCIPLFVALCPLARAEDGAPLVLKNRHLALTFDRQTGGWISLVDSSTHDELIEQPAPPALMLPAANPKLDPER